MLVDAMVPSETYSYGHYGHNADNDQAKSS